MKQLFPLLLLSLFVFDAQSQLMAQATVKRGITARTVDVYVKPSASFSQKDEALIFAIALPATLSPAPSLGTTGVMPNGTGPVSGITGTQPSFLVNNLASTQREVLTSLENINGAPHYIYTFIFAGTAASDHNWAGGAEQRLFSVQFNGCAGNCTAGAKLVSLPGGGATQQAYWYLQPNTLGDITNYTMPFYANGDALPPVNGGSPTGAALSYIQLADVTLPVKMLSFDAAEKSCTVALSWAVTDESKLSHYAVERSTDGLRYFETGQVKPTHLATTKTYTFADGHIPTGTFYYRLKIVDKDGKLVYSSVKTVSTTCREKPGILVYPTLSTGDVTVKLPPGYEEASVRVLSAGGAIVLTDGSKSFFRILNLGRFSNGTYTVQVINKGKLTDHAKVILRRE